MDWLEQCQFFSFFFRGSRIRVDSFFNESSLFVEASRPRILVSLVETSTTTSGAFKREFAVADHARVISRSFVRHSRSFLLRFIYVHWNVFSRLKPDIIKIHILMKNRIVRFYRVFEYFSINVSIWRGNFYSRNFYAANTNRHWAARHHCHVNYDASGVIREWNRVS